ncbi:ketosteroid isomerase-like protein [Catenulispora sp. GAS73]|uniref:nuclear transport factor 2 family protein n=1 Tax=Catenulispora sp. GAS73 TaxID=3156269 RepID=UPI003518F0C6
MASHDQRRLPPSSAVTAIGLDHVRLSYLYLDSRDIDAYGSLLAEEVQVTRPDTTPRSGRHNVLDMHRGPEAPRERHQIFKTVADGDCVAVMGRLIRTEADPAQPDVDFADFFTLSEDGMLLGCRRFYFAPPA